MGHGIDEPHPKPQHLQLPVRGLDQAMSEVGTSHLYAVRIALSQNPNIENAN